MNQNVYHILPNSCTIFLIPGIFLVIAYYNILNKENRIAKLLITFEVNQYIVIATKIYKTDQFKKISMQTREWMFLEKKR